MSDAGPQQKVIAEQLNLSPATVSRSLRDHPSITAETKARVLEMAARLGYRIPDHTRRARRPKNVKNGSIGVLFAKRFKHYMRDPSGAGYLAGLCEQAEVQDLKVAVNYFEGSDTQQLMVPDGQTPGMRDGTTRGLILIHQFHPQVVCWLAEHWPLVTLMWDVPEAKAEHVGVNTTAGMMALVRHLHELGHRKIGFIGNGPGVAYATARYAGYAHALAMLGIPMDPASVLQVTEPIEGWDELAERVAGIVRQRGVTAWVCYSDGPATLLYERLTARFGLKIPQDLSITGFDGSEPSPWMPQVTTIRVPFTEMGAAAIARLAERIENPLLFPRQTMVNGDLIVGGTTGPAPSCK
jgi:LacI family transcriptional regulator